MVDERLQCEIERLRKDFAEVTGAPFKHFYCPILHVDEPCDVEEPGEVIKGHIIPKALGGSATVAQRKDVDNFYGDKVEADFIAAIQDRGKDVFNLWLDPKANRRHRPSIELGNEKIGYYRIRKRPAKVPAHHAAGKFILNGGEAVVDFALKKPLDQIFAPNEIEATLQLTVERDYSDAAVASGIKAAHLTCFKIFGYRYVLSFAGNFISSILQKFFVEHRATETADIALPMKRHFRQHRVLVRPLLPTGHAALQFKGTLIDSRVIHCIGATERTFAVGIIVNAGGDFLSVFLPGEAEAINTYFDFLESPPPSMLVNLAPLFPIGGNPETRVRVYLETH